MSADLFAAFGDLSQPSQTPAPAPKPSSTQVANQREFGLLEATAPSIPAQQSVWRESDDSQNVAQDDSFDDFGDFEGAETNEQVTSPNTALPSAARTSQQPQPLASAAFGQRSAQAIPQPSDSFNDAPWPDNSPQQSVRRSEVARARLDKIAPDPDVLFDATNMDEDADDDDDFGDFEDSVSTSAPVVPVVAARKQHESASLDLLGLDDDFAGLDVSKDTVAFEQISSNTLHQASKKAELAIQPAKKSTKSQAASFQAQPAVSSKPKTPPAAVQDDASWDKFDEWNDTEPTKPAPNNQEDPQIAQITKGVQSLHAPEPSTDDLPPTNVPPPAIVLSLFPPIFAEAQNKFFKPLAAQSFRLKNRILAESAVSDFLKAYLLLGIVAARVIAGRKHRWKRDPHLSQGMRIGPASSRGTSGMKLTGMDKGEAGKEDRETLDVVRAWREQLGRLRSAVASINSNSTSSTGPIVELQEVMPVRVAKESEGGVAAPQPCGLCGLKRNERVDKVDVDVLDSFGEWWIDRTRMHRACRNFWVQHRDSLRQRRTDL